MLNLGNNIYPIGSIYMTIDANFNPNTNPLFGTGWVKLPNGYFIQSASSPLIDNSQSLPNIKGALVIDDQVASETNSKFNGAIYTEKNVIRYDADSALKGDGGVAWFDASKYCNVYQDTTTVKPKSLNVIVWRKSGSISENNARYETVNIKKYVTITISGGSSSCKNFCEMIHNYIGTNSTRYLINSATFRYNGRAETVPAGGYIKTFTASGFKGVWLNTSKSITDIRYQSREVYGDESSINYTISWSEINLKK